MKRIDSFAKVNDGTSISYKDIHAAVRSSFPLDSGGVTIASLPRGLHGLPDLYSINSTSEYSMRPAYQSSPRNIGSKVNNSRWKLLVRSRGRLQTSYLGNALFRGGFLANRPHLCRVRLLTQ
jgi:hypothetical protein